MPQKGRLTPVSFFPRQSSAQPTRSGPPRPFSLNASAHEKNDLHPQWSPGSRVNQGSERSAAAKTTLRTHRASLARTTSARVRRPGVPRVLFPAASADAAETQRTPDLALPQACLVRRSGMSFSHPWTCLRPPTEVPEPHPQRRAPRPPRSTSTTLWNRALAASAYRDAAFCHATAVNKMKTLVLIARFQK